MSTILEGFTSDNFGFYENEIPFHPVIAPSFEMFSEQFNCCSIKVDLSKSSNLNFDVQKNLADQIIQRGGRVLWDVDFKIFEDAIDLNFEGHFSILNRGFTTFLEKLVDPYLKHTFGVCLFKGSACSVDFLPWNTLINSYFNEWLEDEFYEFQDGLHELDSHLKRLFLIRSLSEYLHRFSARVLDGVLSFAMFDTRGINNKAKLFQMFSKKMFNHIHLILSHHTIPLGQITAKDGFSSFGYFGETPVLESVKEPPSIGICFPEDKHCTNQVLNQFNDIFERLNERGISYRIFPEYDGMHGWDQLEKIIVVSKTLSKLGYRVAQGFCAAMGTIVYYDEPLGLAEEVSFSDLFE